MGKGRGKRRGKGRGRGECRGRGTAEVKLMWVGGWYKMIIGTR